MAVRHRRQADPYHLGPWKVCAACSRRYRPASPDRRCYECSPIKPTTRQGEQ